MPGQRNAAVAAPFLTGQVGAPDSQRQHAVGPELVMVVDVLVTQQKAEQPLRNQLPHRMLDPPLAPVVLETGRQPRRQVEQRVGLAQQQRAAVGAEPAALEVTEPQQFPLRFEPFEK